MEFEKSVTQAIKNRVSCRSFDTKDIDKLTLQLLNDYIEQINAQMKIKAKILIACKYDNGKRPSEKLGTYGMISGASSFMIGVVDKKEEDALRFGYWFEKVILFATHLGLGTCWLGGTFSKSDFTQKAGLQENEFIPIVSPVGIKKEKPRLFDSAVRAAAGSNKRKPWNELFYEEHAPLRESDAYAIPLQMVRLAPSASNKQPWRIIKSKNNYHFFLCRTKGYGSQSFDVQKNDVGIAMCHFELTANELGLHGGWVTKQEVEVPDGWEYVTTWAI